MMCHEYGWTVDQVFSNTKDQIFSLADAMAKRKEGEQIFLAKIHGAELKKTRENTVDAGDTNRLKSMGINIVEE